MKSLFLKLPEYSLLLLIILAAYSPPFHFNPFFVGLALLLVVQIVLAHKFLGLIIGLLYLLASLLFLGALVSELAEFTSLSKGGQPLILVGLPLGMVLLTLSASMIYKYSAVAIRRPEKRK